MLTWMLHVLGHLSSSSGRTIRLVNSFLVPIFLLKMGSSQDFILKKTLSCSFYVLTIHLERNILSKTYFFTYLLQLLIWKSWERGKYRLDFTLLNTQGQSFNREIGRSLFRENCFSYKKAQNIDFGCQCA